MPENTMPAFQHAVDHGYRYVETDVQVTNDGVLVAFHDNDLSRTCGRDARISELPWSQVRTALVDGKAPIPLLEEMFGAWPELRVNIDCKSDAAVDALVATLQRCAALHRVSVGAFSDRRIKRLRGLLGPQLCSALGPIETAILRFGRPRRAAGNAAQIPVRQGALTVLTKGFLKRAHHLGIKVHVWTIDEPKEMNRLLDLGVDGVMTDRPVVLRQVFEQRGLWP